MSSFIFNLRVTVYYSFDFYCLVVVELEVILIYRGQAWPEAESTTEKGDQT